MTSVLAGVTSAGNSMLSPESPERLSADRAGHCVVSYDDVTAATVAAWELQHVLDD